MNNNSPISTNSTGGSYIFCAIIAFACGGGIGILATRKYYSDKYDAIAITCSKLENDINHLKEKVYE